MRITMRTDRADGWTGLRTGRTDRVRWVRQDCSLWASWPHGSGERRKERKEGGGKKEKEGREEERKDRN